MLCPCPGDGVKLHYLEARHKSVPSQNGVLMKLEFIWEGPKKLNRTEYWGRQAVWRKM